MVYGPKSYNLDINQLGTSPFPRFAIDQQAPYKDALVEDIILNESHPDYATDSGTNIGMARIRIIPDDRGVQKEQLNWAMPLESTIREYPLKNEIVMVFYSVGRMFYTRRVNITNKITESSWPGLSGKFSTKQAVEDSKHDIVVAAQGGPAYRPWGNVQSTSLGDEFAENPSVKMIRPFEGDTIFQGRYGNIIRFGSSLFSNPTTPTPQPNLLITVGQNLNKVFSTTNQTAHSLVYEDINSDKNSIWLVTDETVKLRPATIESVSHLRSTEVPSDSTKYTGAQIFINSDRVIVNSKINEISLFAKAEINLSAVQSITLDSAKSVIMTAVNQIKLESDGDIYLKGKRISLITTEDISYSTTANYVISGKKIFIGSDGEETQPIVLGGELAKWLRTLIQALSFDLVTAFTTLNPQPFANKMVKLSQDIGLPGTPVGGEFVSFNSTSNFTSKTNS